MGNPASKLNILIGLPVYGGSIKTKTALSLIDLTKSLLRSDIRYSLMVTESTDIIKARNQFGSSIVRDKKFTHLLFIDADMEFRISAFDRLVAADKPFIGCNYARRSIDLPRALALAKDNTPETAVAKSSRFTMTFDGSQPSFKDGKCLADKIGMGLALIKREVFEQLVATKKLRTITNAEHGQEWGFFDPIVLSGNLSSEDTAFCWRWRKLCNGGVWAIVDEPIGHIGEFTYSANILDTAARPKL